jgi:cytoskeletal protein CcmA (bactofilin family)
MMSLKLRHLRIIELNGKIVVNREIQGKDLECSGRAVFEGILVERLRRNIKI